MQQSRGNTKGWGMTRALGVCLGVVALAIGGGSRVCADEADTGDNLPQGIKQLLVTQPTSPAGQAPDERGEPVRVSMDFQDANLKDVLKTFSQQTGINVIAGPEVGDQSVTLYLEDVTVMDALDQILNASNLTYQRPPGSNIYTVKPKGTQQELTVTRVYRLKYARVSESILAKAAARIGLRTSLRGAVLGGVGEALAGGGGGGTGGGAGAGEIGRAHV